MSLTKFESFNSSELFILKEYFKTLPMMDTYIANIIESYIYSFVREYYPLEQGGSIKIEYKAKYGFKNGEYREYHKNGKVRIKCNFIDDKKEGILRHYNNKGTLIIITKYKDGKEVFYPNYDKQLLSYYTFGLYQF